MSKINDGGPAFSGTYFDEAGYDEHINAICDGAPVVPPTIERYTKYHRGMSLRDALAIAALPAIITTMAKEKNVKGITPEEVWSATAYMVADAMLKARLP